MGVLQRGPRLESLVLEDENVAQTLILLEIHDATAVGTKDLFKLPFAENPHINFMSWCFDDDLMTAHPLQ